MSRGTGKRSCLCKITLPSFSSGQRVVTVFAQHPKQATRPTSQLRPLFLLLPRSREEDNRGEHPVTLIVLMLGNDRRQGQAKGGHIRAWHGRACPCFRVCVSSLPTPKSRFVPLLVKEPSTRTYATAGREGHPFARDAGKHLQTKAGRPAPLPSGDLDSSVRPPGENGLGPAVMGQGRSF